MIRDVLGATYSTCELVASPRKSSINGVNLILSKPKRVTPVAGVATIALTETNTSGEKVQFTLNWNDGVNYGSVIFDPIVIPNAASVDLSTLLTVSRG